MSELLPCPFCGGKAVYEPDYANKRDIVKLVAYTCDGGNDGAECNFYMCGLDEQKARDRWNRRTPSPKVDMGPCCESCRMALGEQHAWNCKMYQGKVCTTTPPDPSSAAKEAVIVEAFLDARDSKPPMSEEVRRAMEWFEGEWLETQSFEYGSTLAAEVRRLRGEKI